MNDTATEVFTKRVPTDTRIEHLEGVGFLRRQGHDALLIFTDENPIGSLVILSDNRDATLALLEMLVSAYPTEVRRFLPRRGRNDE